MLSVLHTAIKSDGSTRNERMMDAGKFVDSLLNVVTNV